MLNVIRQFVKEEEGLAAAEYAILLTLIGCIGHRGYDLQGSHCDRVWDCHETLNS